jgi:hypothetical protein
VSDTGTRHERSLKAVEEIGPAVFNGGFTTFLALALLGFSTSQIFLTFFKVIKRESGSLKTFLFIICFLGFCMGGGGSENRLLYPRETTRGDRNEVRLLNI